MSKVSNMISRHSGRKIANQFEILESDARVFQSYETRIVVIKNGQVYLDPAWNRSATTAKYRNQFLGETLEETRAKIANGTYRVEPLNV